MQYLGIDLGGTNIAAAAVTEEGTLLSKVSLPTPRDQGPGPVADQMARAARKAAAAAGLTVEQVASIGVGSPGAIDPAQGLVRRWSALRFQDVPLAALLENRLGRAVVLENDANAAALGEYAAGAGRGCRSLVAVTLGTGVGGGAVLDGKLYTGFNYAGLEVGHFVLQEGGRLCTCGRRGCFEAYCSATALIARTREAMAAHPDSLLWQLAGQPDRVEGRTPFDAAALGDPAARAVLEEYTRFLGCGITSLVNLFQPEVLCIGGGPSAQGERLLGPVRRILDREDYARAQPCRTRLVTASLGNDAGIIGAALLPRFR